MEKTQKVIRFEEYILEARKRWDNLNDKTSDIYRAFEESNEGKDLASIGVYVEERTPNILIFKRRGGPMATVETWKDADDKYCYEYTSSKKGVERYNLSRFDTPTACLRGFLLRIIRNNIPAAIIPKKDIPSLNFNELVPIGSQMAFPEILARMKGAIGGEELTDLDANAVQKLPIIQNLEDMGMVGRRIDNRETIIKKVDIISPKYKFYSRAAFRVGEIYGKTIAGILKVKYDDLKKSSKGKGLLFDDGQEIWRVNNSNRLPLNSINYRTGDNSVKCNIQDEEIFGSVFVSIFIRTFKRAKGRYENEKLINSNSYILRNEGQETIEVATDLNGLLSDYFTEAAARLEPTIFINPEDDNNRSIMDNANALLIKYLMKHGSAEIRERIMKNSDLDELVSITTKHEDIDDATRKLIRVSRALRFI
jgi:hypothetical protein